jgi:glucokinase
MTLTIGLDIGGTKIAGGLVDETGVVLAEGRRDTPATDPDAIARESAALVRDLEATAKGRSGDDAAPPEVVAVGVACAGFINKTGSHVLFAPNLAWRDEPLKARLESMIDKPVLIENDANAAAWGEFRFGGGRDADDMLLITVGTGVGGGCVVDSRLLRGAYGIAGELGHVRVVPNGLRCGCGNRGCLEMYASGSALVREARELVASGTPHASRLTAMCDGDPMKLRGTHVTQAAQAGDAAAVELLEDLGRWLGEGIASIGAVLDPELVVIGGGVAAARDLLLGPAQRAFDRNLIGRGHRPVPRIVLAHFGNEAGIIGAAALAAEGVGR